jgi:hypothetical protein
VSIYDCENEANHGFTQVSLGKQQIGLDPTKEDMCTIERKTIISLFFQVGIDLVKMKKLGKKKSFTKSWEGLYLFVGYVDE